MKIICAMLLLANAVVAMAQKDSIKVSVNWGSQNQEMNELYQLLKVDPYQFSLSDEKLKNKSFILSYAEYENGKLIKQSETTGGETKKWTTYRDTDTGYTFKVYAFKSKKDTVEFFFKFPRFGLGLTFKTLERSDYSLRDATASLGKKTSYLPVGRKIPLLVYALPYEDAKYPGSKFYCALTNDGVPPEKWWTEYKVKHYIIFYLAIEP